ncbi:MAG TPA: polymer-forming cytoskeletal protein [Polyangiaceae bacterium]|nr:polymer-forming cytoskeletal protein [Polyangiaceae bacterium]
MAAANLSVIGRTTRVHGRVTGAVDLEVQGFVEGEIAVGGDVTVDAHGMVGAGVRGRRLVVRGAVKGDLVGEEAVLLEDGARVVGDVRAPRVTIAPGALVRGFVQTGEPNEAPARTSRPQQAARLAPPAAPKMAPAAATRAAPAPPHAAPAPAIPAPARPAAKPADAAHAVGAISSSPANSTPRRPPPPVVPALKKAKGQMAKRKER